MLCGNCSQPAFRLIIDARGEGCANCRGISNAAGAKLSNILTRNSERVRAQQVRHEGDMILPHVFDKITDKVMPNPDFVDMYPDKLPTYFTESELKQAGYSKAHRIFDKRDKQEAALDKERSEVEYSGSDDDVKVVIDGL